jgi:general secretion pathway protein D
MNRNHLRVLAALCTMLLFGSVVLQAKSKADKLFQQGEAAEQRQDWDVALELYLQALDIKAADPQYMIAMRRARLQAGAKHVNAGQKLRAEGKLEESLVEFQKALISDPSSSISIQEIRRTQVMMQEAKKNPSATPEERGMTPADHVRRETEARLASIQSPPELKPVLRTIGPLKMNNQPPKVLFETVGKLAGVNVLFDSQYAPPTRGFNVELGVTTPEQAFDYLAILTHTFWKPVAGTAVFVAEDNPTKHRDYDDEVVKTFYITNATSVQEFQEIATAIRTVADIRRVFTYNAQKAMIVRGSLDAVGLAEKLVHDLDKPKSEVVIDVIVMQANSSRTRDLAASIVNSSGTPGLNVPFVFSPRNPVVINGNNGTAAASGASGASGVTGTTGATGAIGQLVALNGLSHISTNDFSTSLPGALLNLMLSDSKNKILNSPTLRVSDGMTAELKVGQRIPYATGSFQPGVGSVGVSPLVSTQFNYIDTGVNLKIVQQVHSNSEVTLHIEVDISSVAQYINLGGLSQPVIGQNKNTADLRLREGEVNILGGLSQLQDSKAISGIPGLVDMPVLGSVLFGSNHTDKERGELMIAIIPHIVRTPDYSADNLRGIAAGTDQTVKLSYAPRPADPTAPAPAPPPVPEAPKPAVLQPSPAPAASGQARIGFSPTSIQTPVSYPVTVTVTVDGAADLFSAAPIKIKFDPTKLRLNDASPGDLFTSDGARASSVKDIRNDAGEATLTIARMPGSPGVSGSGAIAVFQFVAVGKGESTITVVDSTLKSSQGQTIPSSAGSIPVTVQ